MTLASGRMDRVLTLQTIIKNRQIDTKVTINVQNRQKDNHLETDNLHEQMQKLTIWTQSDFLPSLFSLQFYSFLFLDTEGHSNTQTGLTDCSWWAPSAQSCIQVGFRWSALLRAIWLVHGEGQGMWRPRLSLMSSLSNWKTRNSTVSKDANISPKK